jgi:fibronectin-binding autotransporter adhesin
VLSGAITATGGGGLIKAGSGTLLLTGANTYSGPTAVNEGVLRLGSAGALGNSNSAVTIADVFNTALDLAGLNVQIGSLAGGGLFGGGVSLGSGTLTTGSDGTSTTFGGIISGLGGLTKIGAGTLTLSGTSTYAGATNVTAGTLLVNGGLSGSVTTVSSGATLGGSGTVPDVTVSGGTLAPGANGIGTLSTGSLSLNASSTSRFELTLGNSSAGGGLNDLVAITGNLTLDGLLQVVELGGALNASDTYTLFDYSGTLTDNGLQLDPAFLTAHPGAMILIDTINTQVLLAVPEPGVFTSLLGGMSLLLGFRRRRQA